MCVIAVCGEALVDLVASGPTTYDALPGGSPANTAVALARLGTPVTMLARLSDDAFGSLLREHLVRNGVNLAHAVAASEPSSLAIAARAADGSASYRFVVEGTADWQWTDAELPPLPADVVAVHTGSLALARTPALEHFIVRERAHATVSIDPNLRPALMGDVEQARRAVARWLGLADVFKASTEDVALLQPGEDPIAVARRWSAHGPRLVLVTAGAGGVTALLGDDVLHRSARSTQVVDTIGAGDTFTAGLLAALHAAGQLGGRLDGLTPADLEPALDYALRAAAVTCSRAGADPPYASEL